MARPNQQMFSRNKIIINLNLISSVRSPLQIQMFLHNNLNKASLDKLHKCLSSGNNKFSPNNQSGIQTLFSNPSNHFGITLKLKLDKCHQCFHPLFNSLKYPLQLVNKGSNQSIHSLKQLNLSQIFSKQCHSSNNSRFTKQLMIGLTNS